MKDVFLCNITYTFIQKSSVLLCNGLKSPHAQQDENNKKQYITQCLPKIAQNVFFDLSYDKVGKQEF